MRMTHLVVSFNRHFFGIAILACMVGIALILLVDSFPLQLLLGVGIGLATWFLVASVIASYVVYDASDLYRLKWWPSKIFRKSPGCGVLVHAGFDPASPALRRKFPDMRLRVLDFFDAQTTTEASIQRAHQLNSPPAPLEVIQFDSWPVADGSQDAVFALSAAHELRKDNERVAFFGEAKRVLNRNGRIVVIEQMRDGSNFACFGFAAFHFLPRTTWLRSFRGADLTLVDEFKITPFMTAFVLQVPVEPSQKCTGAGYLFGFARRSPRLRFSGSPRSLALVRPPSDPGL